MSYIKADALFERFLSKGNEDDALSAVDVISSVSCLIAFFRVKGSISFFDSQLLQICRTLALCFGVVHKDLVVLTKADRRVNILRMRLSDMLKTVGQLVFKQLAG